MRSTVCAILLLCAADLTRAADTVIVCPPAFRNALQPWAEYRAAQGRTFDWVADCSTPERIRAAIRAHPPGELRAILLVGDIATISLTDLFKTNVGVPTHYARAKVNVLYGSEPDIATDNWYADLDDDGLPDVPIGRLTADSPSDLANIVRKILAYEQGQDFGQWRHRVNLVAGLGGFGMIADAALELAAKKLIADGVPASYSTTMTYGSWRSPYCPDPREFGNTAIARMTEGCLFWVYMGHGQEHSLDYVSVPGGLFGILENRDMPLVTHRANLSRQTGGSPLAFFLSCYTGAFDAPQDCLAEELLRTEGGPVAVFSSTRVTMPYAMAVLGTELLAEAFQQRRATFGEALLHAQRNTMLRPRTDPTSQLLDNLAKLLSPGDADLQAERAEHVLLFNLLGDPLLRLRHPREVPLQLSGSAAAGEELTIVGQAPIDGVATVELVVRRDRLRFTPAVRADFDPSPAALADFHRVYEQANNPCLVSTKLPVVAGKFETKLRVPDFANGACHLRVRIEGKDDFAAGAVDLAIPPQTRELTKTANGGAPMPASRGNVQ